MATRVATDSFDQLVWTLDETSSPWVSSGAAPAATLVKFASGDPDPDIVTGLFGNAVSFDGVSGIHSKFLTQGNGQHTDGEITSNVTLSAWVYPRNFAPHPNFPAQAIVLKAANNTGSSWSNPYVSVGLYLYNDTLTAYIAIGGALTTSTGTALTLNAWNFVGLTYDGTNVRLYVNGALVSTTSHPGLIDYATHGPWAIGNDYSFEQILDGIVDDVRWASTVRDASWFSNVYTQGTSSGGGGGGGGGGGNGGKSLVRQDKVRGTDAGLISDSVALADIAGPNAYAYEDLNAIRSQLKRILGTSAWSDDAPVSLASVKSLKGKKLGSDQNPSTLQIDFSSIGALRDGYDAEADLDVFVNGVLQIAADDYTVPSSTVVQFASALAASDNVTIIIRKAA